MSKQAEPVIEKTNLDASVARAMLEALRKSRADACLAEINEVLKRNNCQIDIALVLRPGQYPQPIFQIVPME